MQQLTGEREFGMAAKREKKSLLSKAFIVKKRHGGIIDEARELSKQQIMGFISHIREYRLRLQSVQETLKDVKHMKTISRYSLWKSTSEESVDKRIIQEAEHVGFCDYVSKSTHIMW